MGAKVELKYLEGTKWLPIKLGNIIGQSISHFMKTTDKICIACLSTDEGKLFLSNNNDQVQKYKEKGISLHVSELEIVFESEVIPTIAFQVFPDASFSQISLNPKQEINKPKEVKKTPARAIKEEPQWMQEGLLDTD